MPEYQEYDVSVTVQAYVGGSGGVDEFISAMAGVVRAAVLEAVSRPVDGKYIRNPVVTEVHAKRTP